MKQLSHQTGRRIASALTACCTMLSSLWILPGALPASAEGGSCGPSANWSLNGGVLTVSGTGSVSSVAWTGSMSSIYTVVVEDGITSMPNASFQNAAYLAEITVGSGLSVIPQYFASGCHSLKKLKLKSGIETIGTSAFYECSSLAALELPATVTGIGPKAFYACIGLKELSLPAKVTRVYKDAFNGNNIHSLVLNDGLQTIDAGAFNNSCFEEVVIPDSVTSIGSKAFNQVYTTVSLEYGALRCDYIGDPRYVRIVGTAGSTAEAYAKSENLPFSTEPGAHTHSWGEWKVKTQPTCTENGVEYHQCSGCQATEEREIAALGHDWGEWVVTKQPTDTEEGTETHTCSRCKATEERPIEKLAHTEHRWGEWKVKKQPTCTEDGVEIRTCSVCGASETLELEALGHDWGEWKVTKQPTIHEEGEETRTCKRCSNKEIRATDKIPSYWIYTSAGEGGTVSPESTQVAEHSDLVVTFKPNSGFVIGKVIIDEKDMGTIASYTFKDITADHRVSVQFYKDVPPVVRTCEGITAVVPEEKYWFADEASFSMKDFRITAAISENGKVTDIDITKDCTISLAPKDLLSTRRASDGTFALPVQYNGTDSDILTYLKSHPLAVSVIVIMRGDVNDDGEIALSDVLEVLEAYSLDMMGVPYNATPTQLLTLDIDGNGSIDLRDVLCIVEYYSLSMVGVEPAWSDIL